MGFTSGWHWLVLLIVVVLVFGTKKLRNVGKDLGTAVHDFKAGLNQDEVGGEAKTADEESKAEDKV